MPKRIPRVVGRYVREHLVLTLVALIVVNSLLTGFAIYRISNVTSKIVDVQVANCESGNVARSQIRFTTKVLRDLIDVSLSVPPDRVLTVREMAARSKLIETFVQASRRLSRRLPELAPRDCDRNRIIAGVLEPPAR